MSGSRSGLRLVWAGAMAALGILVSRSGAQPRPPPLTVAEAFAGARVESYRGADGSAQAIYVFGTETGDGAPKPAIVFFHGSGWLKGWVVQFAPLARALAAQGMIAACADYRTQSSAGATPWDAMADARAAISWLRAPDRHWGIDPDRVAAGGASSGAQMALMAALPEGSNEGQLAALVLFSAITDTTQEGYPAGVDLFAGQEIDASPRHHLQPDMPPVLLLHGEADPWVPVTAARRFATESAALGNDVQLITFAARGHAFFNAETYRPGVRPDDYYTTLFLTQQFFSRLGWLPRPERVGSTLQPNPSP